MILRQTLAMFVDSYRELNSKRLFWLVLGLSGLIVASFGLIGVEEDSISLLGWKTAVPLAAFGATPESIYKLLFVNLGIQLWLAWGATILALVSTAGVIPDFVSGGAIDLTLSKPMGRVRLFLTKFAASLLFVALQVCVFCLGAFLVIGLRGGSWEPGLFIAVPIMIVFFSYLYSVCALVGLLTRSTITALLVTILFWMVVFLMNTSDQGLAMFEEQTRRDVAMREARVARLEERERGENRGVVGAMLDFQANALNAQRLERERNELEEARADLRSLEAWHGRIVAFKTVLPKTSETVALLERSLLDMADLREGTEAMMAQRDFPEAPPPPEDAGGEDGLMAEMARDPQRAAETAIAVEEEFRARSVWWVVGTSLGFEAVVLAAACWVFKRRDY